jgi:hypothetical protein
MPAFPFPCNGGADRFRVSSYEGGRFVNGVGVVGRVLGASGGRWVSSGAHLSIAPSLRGDLAKSEGSSGGAAKMSRQAARRNGAPAGAKGWLVVSMCQIASVRRRARSIWATSGPRVDAVLQRRAVADQMQPEAGQLALAADARVGQPDLGHQVAGRQRGQQPGVDLVGLAGQRRQPLDPCWRRRSARPSRAPPAGRARTARRSSTRSRRAPPAPTSPPLAARPRSPSASGGEAHSSTISPSGETRQTSTLRRRRSNPACNMNTGLQGLASRSHDERPTEEALLHRSPKRQRSLRAETLKASIGARRAPVIRLRDRG